VQLIESSNSQSKRRKLIVKSLLIAACSLLVLTSTALAGDFGTEAVSQGDGIVSRGGCTLGPPTITETSGDLQASAPFSCSRVNDPNDTRVLKVKLAEVLADGTYRVFEIQQRDIPGDRNRSGVITTTLNTSCTTGPATEYAVIVSVKRDGVQAVQEAGPSQTFNVTGCQ
jgi:hypothetical protein